MRCLTLQVGAVLSHRTDDGSENLISFMSSFSLAEHNYSQIGKEE